MIRKFALVNSKNERYELSSNSLAFFNEPKGLGFTKEISVEQFGISDKITNEFYERPVVSGEMIFTGSVGTAYQSYFDFTSFIANKPLVLEYLPPNMREPYYAECTISSIEKSEVTYVGGILRCPITFLCTTLWKRKNENVVVMQKQLEGDGKYHPLLYPYTYTKTSFDNVPIDVVADIPLPFKLNIDGNITNPRLTVAQNGVEYGIIQLSGTFDNVYINTDDRDEDIRLELGNAVLVNPYNYQDFSVVSNDKLFTFFDLKVGRNIINFTCQNIETFDGTVQLTWSDIRSTI